MKKWIVLILAFFAITPAHATPEADEFDERQLYGASACVAHLESRCWKPMADRLAALKEPVTDKQLETLISAYWMLAKEAEYASDLNDSKSFYGTTLRLASGLKIKDVPPVWMNDIILCDTVELALRMHDYALALRQIDEIMSHDLSHQAVDSTLLFFRAAALIGLGRTTESNTVLDTLLQKLDYADAHPWEAWPLGPQPLDPYDTARRIAAYFSREHRYADALALLKMLEAKRQKTLAEAPLQPERGGYWANLVEPQDFMNDEADVYIAQGKDDEAENLLKASLALLEKRAATKQERKVLEKLAAIEKRNGKITESAEFLRRAASLAIKEVDSTWPDPLNDTLGLPNSARLSD